MPERLGILGGTFDPIHRGHIETAETVKACLGLDRVLLTPSHVPPHRSAAPRASSFDRFAMTALAAAAHPGLVASAIELVREGPSYTADTLDLLHAAGHAASQLFFITGADAFAEIATWRRYPALLDACHFVAVARPGFSLAELRLRAGRADRVRAEHPRDLHAGDAHTRARAGDEQPFALLQVAARDHQVVRGEKHDRAGAGLVPAHAMRHAERLARVHRGVLGEAAVGAAHDARADGDRIDTRADRDDFPRGFEAAGPQVGVGPHGRDPAATDELAAIERGRVHLHEDLAGLGLRPGHLRERERVGARRVRSHQPRTHPAHPHTPLKFGARFSANALRPSL